MKRLEAPADSATAIALNAHYDPRLSDLDLEMIAHVRPGGNWQDIPSSVRSSRLEQIRQMSAERGIVRTTYYGRLRSDQPAYTIATYYDRPGNGTNIHPWEHRTISHREAARLQSFPDRFEFIGSGGSLKRQIGNAVPPLMAYALGQLMGPVSFVDLFSGAGGLSFGLQLAGLRAIAAQELDKPSAETYEHNHRDVRMIVGDICEAQVKDSLFQAISSNLSGREVDLIVGGPPCQGFSTAGWRRRSDRRNSLVYEYLAILGVVRPRLFVFENVEGILSMQGGRVVRELLGAFRSLGYKWVSDPWTAHCEQYGVPQMRRRVIIMGARASCDALGLPSPFFDRCYGRREQGQDRRSARYPVTVAEALLGIPPLREVVDEYRPGQSIDPAFSDWATSKTSTRTFLEARGEQKGSGGTAQALPLRLA